MVFARQIIQCPPCVLPSSALGNFYFHSKSPSSFSSKWKFKQLKWRTFSANDDDEGYLVDAPVMVGDGFSFGGGKYSDMPSKADEWFQQGKLIRAYSIGEDITKAKDPIFGLAMGQSSQVEDNTFRWFCVEAGDARNPTVVLIHGLPSQAYSFRKVLPILSQDYHVVAFDWLGFGFSDKPQPKYGFDYTMHEYRVSLGSLLEVLDIKDATLVCQGYFSPVVVDYAKAHQENLKKLILINPPLTGQHAKLPSSLSSFSNFLLGEIFSQDPLRASDKLLTSCGPYLMAEEDAMVYRRPYLTSGSSGFALTAISRVMKKEIKESIKELRSVLESEEWEVSTTIIWGMRDKWLNYDGVEKYVNSTKHELIQLPKFTMAGCNRDLSGSGNHALNEGRGVHNSSQIEPLPNAPVNPPFPPLGYLPEQRPKNLRKAKITIQFEVDEPDAWEIYDRMRPNLHNPPSNIPAPNVSVSSQHNVDSPSNHMVISAQQNPTNEQPHVDPIPPRRNFEIGAPSRGVNFSSDYDSITSEQIASMRAEVHHMMDKLREKAREYGIVLSDEENNSKHSSSSSSSSSDEEEGLGSGAAFVT